MLGIGISLIKDTLSGKIAGILESLLLENGGYLLLENDQTLELED